MQNKEHQVAWIRPILRGSFSLLKNYQTCNKCVFKFVPRLMFVKVSLLSLTDLINGCCTFRVLRDESLDWNWINVLGLVILAMLP